MREIFGDLIGNEAIKHNLGATIADGTSSHAYIIDGPRGSGKRTVATLAAAALSCENRQNAGAPLPCGHCPVCKRILHGQSADVITVSPHGKATIGVDEIREIKSGLYVVPNDSDMRVYIIEQADKMTVQAQNSFLISLEDPPSFVTFFLLTEDASALLETVRSRSTVLRTELFGPDEIEEYLDTVPGADGIRKRDPEKFYNALRGARGSIGAAKEILFPSESGRKAKAAEEKAMEFAEYLFTAKTGDAISWVLREIPAKRGLAVAKELILYVAEATRDLTLLMKSSKAPAFLFTDRESSDGIISSVPPSYGAYVFENVAKAMDRLESNVSPRICYFDLVFSCEKNRAG